MKIDPENWLDKDHPGYYTVRLRCSNCFCHTEIHAIPKGITIADYKVTVVCEKCGCKTLT